VVFPASQASYRGFFQSGGGFGHSGRDKIVLNEICPYLLCKSMISSLAEALLIFAEAVLLIHMPPISSRSPLYSTFVPVVIVVIFPQDLISWSPRRCPLIRLLYEGSYRQSLCLRVFPLWTISRVPLVWHIDFVPS